MKPVWCWLCGIAILALAPAASGQEVATVAATRGGSGAAVREAAGRRDAAGGGALNVAFYAGQFDTMIRQLALTDEQKAKLRDRTDTMNKEIDTFLSNSPAQITAARRGARRVEGAATRELAAAPARSLVVAKLQDDLQLLINEHQVLINEVLTPEQRLAWETYKLNRVVDARLQTLTLTDDQKDRVKSLVDATAQSLASLKDGKTIQNLQGQLFRKIVADVLTDRQVGKLMEGALPIPAATARGAETRPARTRPDGATRRAATPPPNPGMP
jgi:Spy/CpxP family protein refolding chaperone